MTEPVLTGTTPGGLPYPETTGPLNQGANDIKALALAVEAGYGRVIYGRRDGTTDANGVIRVTAPWQPKSVQITGIVPSDRLYTVETIDAAGALVRIYTLAGGIATNAGTAFYYLLIG